MMSTPPSATTSLPFYQRSEREEIPRRNDNNNNSVNPSVHPQFRSKPVQELYCRHCRLMMCNRGMKAILLGNTTVELYSTDRPPTGAQLVYKDYMTQNCQCRIRDAACLTCGNIVGYHVTQPCEKCLDACNNGHFWMFHSDGVASNERLDPLYKKPLKWSGLPCVDLDEESGRSSSDGSGDEVLCR